MADLGQSRKNKPVIACSDTQLPMFSGAEMLTGKDFCSDEDLTHLYSGVEGIYFFNSMVQLFLTAAQINRCSFLF